MTLDLLNPIKLIFVSALFFFAALIFQKPQEKKRSDYTPPPSAIKNFTLGFNYAIADSLWLRAVQDFDYCEQKLNETECKSKSWLFQILNLATEVDPVFNPTMYRTGGLALSIIVSDYAGATVVFDKAMNQYPNDWTIAYAAGYHALYEEKAKAKAARLYEVAGKNGAPLWVLALAGRLAAESNETEYSKQILQGMIESNQDEKIINRLKQKISEIEQGNPSLKK